MECFKKKMRVLILEEVRSALKRSSSFTAPAVYDVDLNYHHSKKMFCQVLELF